MAKPHQEWRVGIEFVGGDRTTGARVYRSDQAAMRGMLLAFEAVSSGERIDTESGIPAHVANVAEWYLVQTKPVHVFWKPTKPPAAILWPS